MKLLHTFVTGCLLAASLLGTSCTTNFEEINTNPNKMTVGDIEASRMLEPIIYGASRQWQYYTWYWNDELIQFTAFTGGTTRQEHRYFISDQDWKGVWNFYSSYANNTLHMASLAAEDGDVAIQAMALTLKVLFMSNLTDMFGDIPYSEAFQGREEGGTKTPKYDSQQEVYEQMFADLATVNAGSVSYGHDVGSMTLATWAYLALLQVRLGFESRGNDNQGRSSQKSDETGVKGGYLDPTSAGNVWHVKTGSGPMTWRHDGTPFGVSDLRGNVAEEVAGFRIYGGELQFIPDNDALTLSGTDLSSGSSSYWKAMVEDSADSLYVAPGTDGTVKIDFDEAETESNRRDRAGHYTKTIVNRQTVDSYSMSMFLSGLTAGEGLTLPRMMQMLLLAALDEDTPSGRIYLKNLADSDKRGRRGGYCNSGSHAGPACLYGISGPSGGYADYGSRPVLFNW